MVKPYDRELFTVIVVLMYRKAFIQRGFISFLKVKQLVLLLKSYAKRLQKIDSTKVKQVVLLQRFRTLRSQ